MPGQNVSLVRVQENQTTGAVIFTFSNGTQSEIPSWADVGGIADEIDVLTEYAEKILIAKTYRESPDGANKANQVGASVSVNGMASVPIVYTAPE